MSSVDEKPVSTVLYPSALMNGTPASSVDRALITLIAFAFLVTLFCRTVSVGLRRTGMTLETRSLRFFLIPSVSAARETFRCGSFRGGIILELAGTGELAFCGVVNVDTGRCFLCYG